MFGSRGHACGGIYLAKRGNRLTWFGSLGYGPDGEAGIRRASLLADTAAAQRATIWIRWPEDREVFEVGRGHTGAL